MENPNELKIAQFQKATDCHVNWFLPKGIYSWDLSGIEFHEVDFETLADSQPHEFKDGETEYYAIHATKGVLQAGVEEREFAGSRRRDYGNEYHPDKTLGETWGECIDDILFIVECTRRGDSACLKVYRLFDLELVKKIRRRIEERLRNSPPSVIMKIAQQLKVETTR